MDKTEIKIYIFDKDDLTATLIENYMKEVDFPYQIIKYSEFDKSLLKDGHTGYRFIFVDIVKANSIMLDDISFLSGNNKNLFFMMSSAPSTDLYVKSLRSGAKEFLRKPFEKDSFLKIIKNNFREDMLNAAQSNRKLPKILAVTSLEGACGKTCFAINTARELAELTKDRVLLIDFNDNLNNVTFSLDIDQMYDTNYFIQYTNEENAKSIFSKLYRYNNTSMYVMSNCMYRTKSKGLSSDNFQNFLKIAKRYFRFIVIDVNNDLDLTNKIIFSNTDMIFYIISSGISANERNQSYINANYDKKKFRIILNKYREKDESKINEIENILGREIFYKIPVNLSVTTGSNNKGKTIREINPDAEILKNYDSIAKYIINRV